MLNRIIEHLFQVIARKGGVVEEAKNGIIE
jgi:hypothetical protein